ncbi:hypothetical protein B0H10DRAFT_1941726 [Mycena sp. CBHHK59/15]|nr:hypothetical protein B0H10DRAFT_1941726 [Mycena sp. CBHHK59/15]
MSFTAQFLFTETTPSSTNRGFPLQYIRYLVVVRSHCAELSELYGLDLIKSHQYISQRNDSAEHLVGPLSNRRLALRRTVHQEMDLNNAQLRSRLSEIEGQLADLDIPHWKDVTRISGEERLREERQRLRDSLDTITYPILTLSVEITSQIFVHCLPDGPRQPNTSIAPLLLGAICHRWRNIAWHDQNLWTSLTVAVGDTNMSVQGLALEWLHRAGGTRPLSLSLRFESYHCCDTQHVDIFGWCTEVRSSDRTPVLLDSVIALSSRWRHVSIEIRTKCALQRFRRKANRITLKFLLLETFTLNLPGTAPASSLHWGLFNAPALREAHFTCVPLYSLTGLESNLVIFSARFVTPDQCVQFLRDALCLETCRFTAISNSDIIATTVPLFHKSLKFLKLGYDPRQPEESKCLQLLSLLTLPTLQRLECGDCTLNDATEVASLHSFCTRSPQLEYLHIIMHEYVLGASISLLRGLPMLKALDLSFEGKGIFYFFDLLNLNYSPTLLPQLETLILSLPHTLNWCAEVDVALVGALVSRWEIRPGVSQLREFRLEAGEYTNRSRQFDGVLADRLSVLMDQGMKLFVRSACHSWI